MIESEVNALPAPLSAVDVHVGHYIHGQLVPGTGDTMTHVNPMTGRAQKEFPVATDDEVRGAVDSSVAGFRDWAHRTPLERRDGLRAIAEALLANGEEIAHLGALEIGTPIQFGRWAVDDAAAWFEYYAGWTDKVTGDTIPVSNPGLFDFTLLEPVGAVLKILTWNTPIGGISMAVPAALAAGCSVVIKPAELTPFVAVRFAELCTAAGIPSGVVNVVLGDGRTGEKLVRHPDIAKISFTGGPATARRIQAAAAENITPLLFELGGKSANIVFVDADLDRATEFSTMVTGLSGQGCSLPTRLLVEQAVHEEMVERMTAALRQVVVGDPFSESTTMGPVSNAISMERILGMIQRAIDEGASCRLGGRRLEGELSDGYFIEPTVLTDVNPASEIAREEVFGPVLSVIPFDSEEQAIEIANSTRFGLAAYVHTRDVHRALRMVRVLDAGGVGVNGQLVPASYATPFGGKKLSGFGREGGREGLMEFMHVKNVAMKVI